MPRQQESLLQLLSIPGENESTSATAAELVSDTAMPATMRELYPAFIRHKTLVVALDHLERAGAELDSVFIPGAMFRSEWPFSLVFAGTPEASLDRVSLAAIRRLALAHEDQLRRSEDELRTHDRNFILLFGRALRAAYPEYRHGMSHDVDIFMPSDACAVPLLEHMCADLGFAILTMRSSRNEGRRLAHVKLFKMSPEGHHLGVDMICSGRPARGLHPPFAPELQTRSRLVVRDGTTLRVPSREDMLLMLVEKIHRRAEFIRRHFNDIEFLLSAREERLDWPYLVDAGRRHGLNAVFGYLLETTRATASGFDVPPDIAARLAPTRSERRLLTLMMPTPQTAVSGPRTTSIVDARLGRRWRIWQAFWLGKYAIGPSGSSRAAVQFAVNLIRSIVFLRRIKLANEAIARLVGELGPTGTLPLRSAFVVDLQKRGRRIAAGGGVSQDGRRGERPVP